MLSESQQSDHAQRISGDVKASAKIWQRRPFVPPGAANTLASPLSNLISPRAYLRLLSVTHSR